MRPLKDLPESTARRVRAVFTDIDDTLTSDGRLEAPAFTALCKLSDHGISVVPVTGRPAGWCDHFARMWPVEGVIGENGALYYRYDPRAKRMVRRFAQTDAVRAKNRRRLEGLAKKIKKAVPRSQIASDQEFRISDLAVDFCEDVDPPLPESEVDRIVALFSQAGATAKVSSIHVNGWFGRFDKLTMIQRFAEEVLELDLKKTQDNRRAVYVGDSPNDEPAFRMFSLSVGVANVRDFEARLEAPPKYVTRSRGGRGFAELARKLLKNKA